MMEPEFLLCGWQLEGTYPFAATLLLGGYAGSIRQSCIRCTKIEILGMSPKAVSRMFEKSSLRMENEPMDNESSVELEADRIAVQNLENNDSDMDHSDDEDEVGQYFQKSTSNPTAQRFFLKNTETDLNTAIGHGIAFEVSPPLVHFSGFEIGKQFRHVVRVINTAIKNQRMSIIPPSTQYFSVECEKKGMMAAGMSQAITVVFKPTEYKYYYDCIRIKAENQDLLIPLHGYPIMNEIDFPKNLSFGSVPLCEPAVKVICMMMFISQYDELM